ncbi:MAG: DUF2277 domain-containing protein [Candidatus Krumholzibacteria bacterium]|nr:DUF2277 domain-containing protein [Candidatus Krumholzibacteria bacterium]
MCRNIVKLRRPEGEPTDQELHDAALQFVRKISGYRVPSQTNRQVFDTAVADITSACRVLFDKLAVTRKTDARGLSAPRVVKQDPSDKGFA